MQISAPTVLVICEGFGYSIETDNNALAQAETPFLDKLCEKHPATLLKAHGNALGYPDYYGSSPYAGFWTLISGEKNITQRAQLDTAIQNGTFFEHKPLAKLLTTLAKRSRRFHIIVTLSSISPEQRIEHILALIHTALFHGVKEIMLHVVLTDNNTFDMTTFLLLEKLETLISTVPQVTFATIQGTSYTSSHTATQATVQESYTVLTKPSQNSFSSWKDLLTHYYTQGIHDCSIPPTALVNESHIQPKDGVIFATYSASECHLLKEYISKTNVPEYPILSLFDQENEATTGLYHQKIYKDNVSLFIHNKHISTLAIMDYDHKNNVCFYAKEHFKNFSQQLHIRSVIQGSHITSGNTNNITEAFIEALNFENYNFYILNYNAAATYAFTHNFQGAIDAIEDTDRQLSRIYEEIVEKRKGKMFITSSYPLLENIQPHPSDTIFIENSNPVFFVAVDPTYPNQLVQLPLTELTDVGPFVLKQLSRTSVLPE